MGAQRDILVVGAGPAGTSAAAAAAAEGVKVLVVERRRSIGVPVRCAEYIPQALLGSLPQGDRGFLVQPVKGMRTFLPDGTVKETIGPGFTIGRDLFDQALARYAKDAGAEVRLGTRAVRYEGDEIILKGPDGGSERVKPRVIIGADGPHSAVAKWMGCENHALVLALQCRFELTRAMEFTEVYFYHDFYGGYAWVFPKGKEANVGLGIVPGKGKLVSLRSTLNWLVKSLKENGRIKGPAIRTTAGWIPVRPAKRTVKENMLLVGDAAGHTHPITGAGIPQAVICGQLAGKWAARAVLEDDLGLLGRYEDEWRDHFGEHLMRAYERRKLLEAQWQRLNEILPYCWVAFREYYGRA